MKETSLSIEEKFWKYHGANPHVYQLFKKFANEARDAGFSSYSARAIFHRLRWHMNITVQDPEGFKINNNYSSRYARLLALEDKNFKDFFKTRTLKSFSIWKD